MAVYFLTFSLSLLIYIFISHGKVVKKSSNVINKKGINRISFAVFIAALPPAFIAAFRYMVGTDYFVTYYTGFYRILDGSKVDKFEFGYYWLNRLIQLFTDNAFVLFFVTGVLFVGVVYKTIEEESINIPLSILLFMFTRYYFVGMNGVRQFIAIAILTYSIKYVIKEDVTKFLLCVFFACSFHYTSIIFVFVYFIARLEVPKRRLVSWTIIDVVFFSFGTTFIINILQGTKYGRYIEKFSIAGENFTLLTIIINLILVCIAYEDYLERKEDKRYRVYLNIQLFAFWISLVLRAIPLMERLYWFFSFPIIITFPYFLQGKTKLKKKIYKYFVLLIFLVYMVYDIGVLGDHGVLPYQFIFGKEAIYDAGWYWY